MIAMSPPVKNKMHAAMSRTRRAPIYQLLSSLTYDKLLTACVIPRTIFEPNYQSFRLCRHYFSPDTIQDFNPCLTIHLDFEVEAMMRVCRELRECLFYDINCFLSSQSLSFIIWWMTPLADKLTSLVRPIIPILLVGWFHSLMNV